MMSIPFVFDFFYTGMNWKKMTPHRETIADPVSEFFIAYLVSDLLTGLFSYRKFVNLSSGWIHHSLYAGFCIYWIIMHWSYAFVFCAIMEIPTWIMGIGIFNPRLRSYWAFTLTFLITRIAIHLFVFGIITFPMHVFWAYKSVRGLYRRILKQKAEAKQRELEHQAIIDEATRLLDSADELEERDALRWRKAYMEELEFCKEQGLDISNIRRSTLVRRALGRLLLQGDKRGHNLPPVNEDDEDDLEDWMSVTSMSSVPEHRQVPKEGRKVSLGKGIQIRMPRELNPILNGQNYIVSEFPVDQAASGTRRQRLLGQMRRRFEIARRDMVVF
ncbi:hypothetical protein MOBT1_000505 [Malassezia obtusa]|uniref:TLC domain-containing protein n=1 Tax=Malassezia obtusa TaxID=76774 RepID=A0AAF0DYN0_9BASI|nr:hypothetical protein MOBT1_000505 [Malassezia obtusa]